MGLSKEELIKKLEAISILHDRALSIKNKMNNFEPEDNYERKVEVPEFPLEVKNEYDEGVLDILVDDVNHSADDAMEYISKCYDTAYHPKKPEEPKKPRFKGADTSELDNKQSKLGCLSYLAIGVSIFFLLGALVGTADYPETRSTILIIAAVAAAAFILLRLSITKTKVEATKQEARAKAEYDREISEINAKYNAALGAYESECDSYKKVRQEFLDKYAAWRDIYLESVAEENVIADKLESERQAEVEKIEKEEFNPVFNDLAQLNDLVTVEYLPVLDVIIDLLRSGRADDLKEAINLYEDMLYRERQLQLEREKEANRQREAAQKQAAEERYHREQMEFQKQQEYNRRREAEQQREAEERRHREEMKQREVEARNRELQERERNRREQLKAAEAQRDQDNKLRSAAQAQCRACAHAGRCNMMVHNVTPNCTGFTPR